MKDLISKDEARKPRNAITDILIRCLRPRKTKYEQNGLSLPEKKILNI